jgi:hypothetical protein
MEQFLFLYGFLQQTNNRGEKTNMRFIHLRKYAQKFRLCDEILPKGGTTIGYVIDGENVKYSISRCNDKDHFNKRIGRLICEGRMKKHCYFMMPLVKEHLIDAIIADVNGMHPS